MMKKVFKYILIALLLFIGLLFGCVLYLFFVRGSSIFGITYVSYSEQKTSNMYSPEQIEKIELSSYGMDVQLVNNSSSDIYCNMKVQAFGFTKVDSSKYGLETTLSQDGKVLKINVTEPHGLVSTNGSLITLAIPSSKTNLNVLTVKNNKAIVKSSLEKVYIQELNYQTENGRLYLNEGKGYNTMNLKVNHGRLYIAKEAQISNSLTNLQIYTGLLDCGETELGAVKLLSNDRSIIRIKKCLSFNSLSEGDFGGTISIGELNTMNYSGSDTVIKLGTVDNPLESNALNITLTKSGYININELNTTAQLETYNGEIKINSTNSFVSKAASKSGNISILKATKKVRAKSDSGNINISFDEESPSYNSENECRSVIIDDIKSGNLTITGAENFDVTSSGKGKTFINSKNIIGACRFSGDSGNVTIQFDNNSTCVVSALSTSGKTRINVPSVPEYNGTINTEQKIYVNCSSSDEPVANSLYVTTKSGNIEIKTKNLN